MEKQEIHCHANTVRKNEKITVAKKKKKKKKISSSQLFRIFFSKNVAFTKFLSKKCDSKFP